MYFLKSLKRSLCRDSLAAPPHRLLTQGPAFSAQSDGVEPVPGKGTHDRGARPGPSGAPAGADPAPGGLPPSLGCPRGCSCNRPSLPPWELPDRSGHGHRVGPPHSGHPQARAVSQDQHRPPLLIPGSLGPPGSGRYPNPSQLSVPPRLPTRPTRSHLAWSSAQPAPSGSFF